MFVIIVVKINWLRGFKMEQELIKLNDRYRRIVDEVKFPIESLDKINDVILELIEILNKYYRDRNRLEEFNKIIHAVKKVPSWRDELNSKIKLFKQNEDLKEVENELANRMNLYFKTGK